MNWELYKQRIVPLLLAFLLTTSMVPTPAGAVNKGQSEVCLTPSGHPKPDPEHLINASAERLGTGNVIKITYDLSDFSNAPFEVSLPQRASLVSNNGFTNNTESAYELSWNHKTRRPSITYSFNASGPPSGQSNIPENSDYGYSDSWSLAPLPGHLQPHVNPQIKNNGVVGKNVVFFGEANVYERTVGCQRIRLVVPDTADMSSSPDAVLDLLSSTARRLNIGHRYTVVTVFASPDEMTRSGFATGPDMVVEDDTPTLSNSQSMWIHEYIHTRQGMVVSPEMKWFIEASAKYYESRLLYEDEYISRAEYERHLINMAQAQRQGVVLANSSTWHNNSEYINGALVLAALDYRIRESSRGTQNLSDVFKIMNRYSDPSQNNAITLHIFGYCSERERTAVRPLVEQSRSRLKHYISEGGLFSEDIWEPDIHLHSRSDAICTYSLNPVFSRDLLYRRQ
ncbi:MULTISPECIES: hypothetical protein [Haloferax]|uniref:Uncharacterized protein n=1 Tax=Haloferax marinum TaxID=2666143 RepID=A0A6A8G7C9_9EURY|nr:MULTISPECIES: hypothetical protein [Haloferax]KAB1197398.1 hypothetical protein Hfx1150_07680 [Haloferax sp. CBA1150]MRW96442.1 hypothetical protein [Haloferax marinum]